MDSETLKISEIKPVLSGYIREAQFLLKKAPIPDDRAVHDVRVAMKKARAVTKLVSCYLSAEDFEKDYYAFREVGRLTRLWRETSVHRKTLRALKAGHPDLFTLLGTNEKLNSLMADPVAQASPEHLRNDLENIDSILVKAGFRIRFRNMGNYDSGNIISELDKTYHRVVRAYIRARINPKPENLHTFRKRAKDFLYQLFFFRSFNEAGVRSLERKLDGLTQALGKFNDLAQLIDVLGYKFSGDDSDAIIDELIIIIKGEQDKYLLKIWPVAYKIFSPGQKLANILGFAILEI